MSTNSNNVTSGSCYAGQRLRYRVFYANKARYLPWINHPALCSPSGCLLRSDKDTVLHLVLIRFFTWPPCDRTLAVTAMTPASFLLGAVTLSNHSPATSTTAYFGGFCVMARAPETGTQLWVAQNNRLSWNIGCSGERWSLHSARRRRFLVHRAVSRRIEWIFLDAGPYLEARAMPYASKYSSRSYSEDKAEADFRMLLRLRTWPARKAGLRYGYHRGAARQRVYALFDRSAHLSRIAASYAS